MNGEWIELESPPGNSAQKWVLIEDDIVTIASAPNGQAASIAVYLSRRQATALAEMIQAVDKEEAMDLAVRMADKRPY